MSKLPLNKGDSACDVKSKRTTDHKTTAYTMCLHQRAGPRELPSFWPVTSTTSNPATRREPQAHPLFRPLSYAPAVGHIRDPNRRGDAAAHVLASLNPSPTMRGTPTPTSTPTEMDSYFVASAETKSPFRKGTTVCFLQVPLKHNGSGGCELPNSVT